MTTEDTIAQPKSSAMTVRRSLPRWAQVAILIAVFVSGGVAGAMITAKVIHARMETYRQQAPLFSEDIVNRLRIRLALSEDQETRVRTIIERHHPEMIEYRNEGSQQLHAEFDAMVTEIASELNELQARRWKDIAEYVRNTFLPPSGHSTSR